MPEENPITPPDAQSDNNLPANNDQPISPPADEDALVDFVGDDPLAIEYTDDEDSLGYLAEEDRARLQAAAEQSGYIEDEPESANDLFSGKPKSQFRVNFNEALVWILLIAILLAGFYLRSVGRNWDDFTHLHPDERFLTGVASRIDGDYLGSLDFQNQLDATAEEQKAHCDDAYPLPDEQTLAQMSEEDRTRAIREAGKGGYFDARCSALNPNNQGNGLYVYGEFPLFTVRTIGETLNALEVNQPEGRPTTQWTEYNGTHLVGRAMNAVIDTLSILLIFLIGRRLFGRWQGLLAASFYAFAAFPIQQSHFWTADAFTAFWVVLSIYFAVRVLDDASEMPVRFNLLPWVGLGLILGIWDVTVGDNFNEWTIIAHLAAFIVAGVGASLAAESQRWLGILTWWVGSFVLLAFMGVTSLTMSTLAVSIILMGLLTFVWVLGFKDYAAYSGLWLWLAAPFALWVFDSMAHYNSASPSRSVSLTPLILFIGLFMLTGLLGSTLYKIFNQRQADPLLSVITASVITGSLVAWVLFGVIDGGISIWGMVAAVAVALYLGFGASFGYNDYLGFGLAFGAAMAGRVNVLPVVGLLILAGMIRAFPVLDWRVYQSRQNIIWRVLGGFVLAGFATILFFRVLQPHAFLGPNFITFQLNPGWMEDIGEAQRLVSPEADFPPAHQWANRTKWLFPLQNIVIYGLGVAVGLSAVLGFMAAVVQVVRGKREWTRLILPMVWILVYFGWLGQNWVATMRYFLPIYGMLALLAAWFLTKLVTTSYQAWRDRPQLNRQLMFGASTLLLMFVWGYTTLYGYGFTSIYRHELTRVQASRYYQENVPSDFGVWIERDDGTQRLVNIPVYPNNAGPSVLRMDDGDTEIVELTPFGESEIINIEVHLLGDLLQDAGNEVIQFAVWSEDPELGRILLGTATLDENLADAPNSAGRAYTIPFEGQPLIPDISRQFSLEVTVLEGGPVMMARRVNDLKYTYHDEHLVVTYQESTSELLQTQAVTFPVDDVNDKMVFYSAGSRTEYSFRAISDGVITVVDIPHVADPLRDGDDETIRIALQNPATGQQITAQASGDFNTADDGHNLFGPSVRLEFAAPFEVKEGESYTLAVIPDDLLGVTGAVVSSEIPWDDPVPYKVCALPPEYAYGDDNPSGLCEYDSTGNDPYSGFYTGLNMPMSSEDDERKRDEMLAILDQIDYLNISSNRFYDSFRRIPTRWPMSLDFYEALFSGELGFELVDTFESYAEVGPFVWRDQILPTDDVPDWMNEFESEEAFSVYDHPTVFIFRKTEDYSPEKAAAFLDVNMRRVRDVIGSNGVYDDTPAVILTWGGGEASQSPTALQLTDPAKDTQRAGGTWYELFNRNAIFNDNQVVGVITWWLAMMVMGWLTFPLLFWLFPALPDKGFGTGKLLGWILVAWVAWFGGALNLPLWTQNGLRGLLLVFIALSAILAITQRRRLGIYLRDHWQHMAIVEGISLALFLFFVGVRLGNPDLWHTSFGGEKPMDFAYFNSILRSSVFPASDPWFAGGFMNYYYWGFVFVGAPVKALGFVPSFAYNLILPTLFSMTGIGAFTVGYNLVAWRNTRQDHEYQHHTTLPDKRQPWANAYVAGLLTILLAIGIGNLDQPRTYTSALMKKGSETLTGEQVNQAFVQWEEDNGFYPPPDVQDDIRAEYAPSNFDALREGFDQALDGEYIPIAAHRWYWGPTRIIGELPDGAGQNAIVEMPYFTFLYGDLHPHMMSMPVTLFALLFVIAEVMSAGLATRRRWASLWALFVGGLIVGLLKAINSWDWPTYMIVGVAGLTYAAWVGQARRTQGQPRNRLFQRLRRALNLRYVFSLWMLLIFIPLGSIFGAGLHVVQSRAYEAKLEANEIPIHCKVYDESIDDPNIDDLPEPTNCESNELKPRFNIITSPIKWGMLGFAGGVGLYVVGLVILGNRFDKDALVMWVARLLGFVAVSVLTIAPFENTYATPYNKILPWELQKTPLWAYLSVHGLFLFIVTSLLLWQTIRWLRRVKVADVVGMSVPLLLVLLTIPATFVLAIYFGIIGEYKAFLVGIPLLVWVSVLFLLPGQSHIERLIYAAIALALGLTLGVEMVVLDGDIGRQNTVFKFYIQAWVLFSVAGGVSLAWLINAVKRWDFFLSSAWQMGLAGLISISLLYPIMATPGRFADRMRPDSLRFEQDGIEYVVDEIPLTLDGMEYMRRAPYSHSEVDFNLNGDYQLIRWLQDNVEGTPYIIEASTGQYQWGGRINIYTGLPTVFGWNWHQRQQRNLNLLNNMVWNRENNVTAFYTTPDIDVAWNLIQEYEIEYIILGSLERAYYDDVVQLPDNAGIRVNNSPGILKFETMVELGLLERAYVNPVCMSRRIFTASECPASLLSTDIVYHVNSDAVYPPPETAQNVGDDTLIDERIFGKTAE